MLLKSLSVQDFPVEIMNYAAGFIAAFGVGLVSLIWFIKVVKKGKLVYFAYYCWAVGTIVIVTRLF